MWGAGKWKCARQRPSRSGLALSDSQGAGGDDWPEAGLITPTWEEGDLEEAQRLREEWVGASGAGPCLGRCLREPWVAGDGAWGRSPGGQLRAACQALPDAGTVAGPGAPLWYILSAHTAPFSARAHTVLWAPCTGGGRRRGKEECSQPRSRWLTDIKPLGEERGAAVLRVTQRSPSWTFRWSSNLQTSLLAPS